MNFSVELVRATLALRTYCEYLSLQSCRQTERRPGRPSSKFKFCDFCWSALEKQPHPACTTFGDASLLLSLHPVIIHSQAHS